MDAGGIIFFGFLGAIIIVPQVLRHQERQRLHDTIRACLAKGQPVPPELFRALRWRRRNWSDDYGDYYSNGAYGAQPSTGAPGTASYTPPPEPVGPAPASAAPDAAFEPSEPVRPYTAPAAAPPPVFVGRSMVERDLRRGLVWLAIGLGLIAAGAAFYAGLYDVGGAPETFSSFAALGAIPLFVGVTYLALWYFGSKGKTV